ncbi:hypothetical protein [Lacinutrix sp. MEBiC02404]
MKKTEMLLAGFILLVFIFKLMHWPYNSEIIALGTVFLSLLYLGFGFALFNNIRLINILKPEPYTGISKLRINGAIATGFVFSILTIYCLFKLMFWPYGHIGLEIGLKLFAFLVVIILVLYFVKNRNIFLKLNYIRFLFIGIIATALYFITNDQLVDLYYGSDPEYAEAYKAYINDSSMDAKRPTREFKSRN